MLHISEVRNIFAEKLKNEDFVIDKTGVKMLEIVGETFIADEDRIFGEVNQDYVQRELDWYKSMSLNVRDIPGGVKQETNPPEIWMTVADPDGFINSNYGWCIWSYDNYDQYDNVIAELKANPSSRRTSMIYTRPSMWEDYNFQGRSDFMCTWGVDYLIRNGKLNAIVKMRSNDSLFGYKNDRFFQKYVLDEMSDELGVPVGDIYWQSSSLHIYERHFYMVDHYSQTGELSVKRSQYSGKW